MALERLIPLAIAAGAAFLLTRPERNPFFPGGSILPSDPIDDLPPSSQERLERMSEREVVARTAWGEARGEGVPGMAAVIAVIRNRARRAQWPNSPKAVALQPFQFSLWNAPLSANGRAALDVATSDPHMSAALRLYDAIITRKDFRDVPAAALNADHYHKSTITPYWRTAFTKTGQIGDHIFYTA